MWGSTLMHCLNRHAQLPSLSRACKPTRVQTRVPAALQQRPTISLTTPRRVAYLLWDLDNVTIRPHADLLATLLSLQALAKAAGAQQLTARMYANPATAKREAALLPILAELGVQVELVPARAQSADLALRGDAVAALKGHPPEDTALLLVSGDTDHAGVLSWATSRGVWTCVAAPWPPPRYAPHLPPRLEGDQLAAACSAAMWLRAPKPAASGVAAAWRASADSSNEQGFTITTTTAAAPPAVQQQPVAGKQGTREVPEAQQVQGTAAGMHCGWMSDAAWSAWLHQQQQGVEAQGVSAVEGMVGASWAAGLWCNPQGLVTH